jgi:tryptophan synthase alpha chain
VADGHTIQAASQRALDGGVNPPFVLDVVREVRKKSQVPIVLMGYYNTAFRCGVAKFAKEMADCGADGIILSDLPPEESDEWKNEADANGIATIFLIAPTSTPERIELVASKMSSGFVYCVSRTGVTGARAEGPTDLSGLLASIRSKTSLPICLGFGISDAKQVRQASRLCDGVVIGSKLVDLLKTNAQNPDFASVITNTVSEWKAGARP